MANQQNEKLENLEQMEDYEHGEQYESSNPYASLSHDEVLAELARVSQENRQLRESLQGYLVDKPNATLIQLEEAQALTLAAETARQMAEDKVLELSRLVGDSVQQVTALQKELETLRAERDEFQTRLAAPPQAAPEEVDSLRLRITEMEQFVSTQRGELENLAKQLDSKEQQCRSLETQLHDVRAGAPQSVGASLGDLKKKISDLQSEVEDYQLALSSSDDQILYLEGELEEREQIIDSMQHQLSGYLQKLHQAQGKLFKVGEAVDKRNQWLRQLQEQNRALLARSRHWEQMYLQASTKAKSEGDEEIDDLRWELEETRVSLEETLSMVGSLQDQVQRQLPATHKQLMDLKAEHQATLTRMAELEARLEQLQQVETLQEVVPVAATFESAS